MRQVLYTIGVCLAVLTSCKKNEVAIDPATAYLGDYDCKYTSQSTDYGILPGARPIETSTSGIFLGRVVKLKESMLELRNVDQVASYPIPLEITGNQFLIRRQLQETNQVGTFIDDVLGEGKTDGKKLSFTANTTTNMTTSTSTTKRLTHASTVSCDCFKK